MNPKEANRMKKKWVLIPAAAVIAAFLLELIQIYTQPMGPEMTRAMHPRRMIIGAAVAAGVLFWMRRCNTWAGIRAAALGGIRGIRACGKKRAMLYAAAFPAGIGAAIFLFWIFCTVFAGIPMTSPRIVFAGFIGFFAACLGVFRKTLKTQPEYLFLILMLCFGFLYSYYVPHTGLNSWDEDYHYTQAVNTSYVDSLVLTHQDRVTIERNIPASYDLNGGVQALHDEQDERFRSGITEEKSLPDIAGIPEAFNGIGLFIGRALGLRYYMIHFMGRFIGLLAYALAGFFAIRKLKSGKMIAAVSLMIPTEVFIASSFNYDCYLTGFTAVGLCWYMARRQDPQGRLTLQDMVIMIGSIAFGCLAKPVYIPLLWILLLLPRDQFASRKVHRRFVLAIAGVSFLVLFTYWIPSLIHGFVNTFSDVRAGSEVSAAGQIQFILSDPLHFVRVVWDYLINAYLNPARAGETLTNLAYIGVMPNAYIYLGLLLTVAFTDKNEYDRALVHRPWDHIWPIIVSLGMVVVVITCLYLSYTPVGADTVAGAQFRYLIPMVLPFLLHIGSGRVENKMNRTWYNGLVFGVIAFVGFSCIYNGYICQYY